MLKVYITIIAGCVVKIKCVRIFYDKKNRSVIKPFNKDDITLV